MFGDDQSERRDAVHENLECFKVPPESLAGAL